MTRRNHLHRLPITGVPVLVQYIVMYLLIAIFVIASLMPIYNETMLISRERYLKETQLSLDKNAAFLQNELEELYILPRKLEELEYYNVLKVYKGSDLPINYYAQLYMSQRFYDKQMLTVEYAEQVLILLSNSGVVFNKQGVYSSMSDCMEYRIVYENYTADTFLSEIKREKNTQRFLPESRVTLNGYTNAYLTVVMNRLNDSAILCGLFKRETLLDLFGLYDLPENSVFYMTSRGEPLLTYNCEGMPFDGGNRQYNDDTYSVLKTSLSMPSTEVTIGIPDSYFSNMLQPIKLRTYRCVLLALLLGVFFGVLFAEVNYLPVRRLMKLTPAGKRRVPNEYDYIIEYMELSGKRIRQLSADMAVMESSLRENLFLSLLYGLACSDNDLQRLPKLLPPLSRKYRVAVIKTDFDKYAPNADYLRYLGPELLRERLPDDCFICRIDSTHTVLLLNDESDTVQAVATAVTEINHESALHGLMLRGGISDAAAGLDHLRTAFYNARFLQTTSVGNVLGISEKKALECPPWNWSVGVDTLQKLRGFIIARDRVAAEGLLLQISDQPFEAHETVLEVFFALRTALHSAAADAQLNSAEVQPPEWNAGMEKDELFKLLTETANQLIDRLEAKRSGANRLVRDKLLTYINQNFAQPSIYAESIAEAVGVFRGFVYTVVREETGLALNEYIEDKRMELARTLLTTGTLPVTEIAVRCGYNSANTFYKAFKKKFGVSPSSMREKV